MKRRIIAALAAPVVAVLLLAGCATTPGLFGSTESTPSPIDLTNPEAVATLCGDPANEVLEYFQSAVEADPESGKRNALKAWGIADPTDEEVLTATEAALQTRAETPCEDVSSDGQVGIENIDGSVINTPFVNGTDGTIVIDTTSEAATPPLLQPDLLDGSLRFTAQTLTWQGLVERVGDQQWYIDGVNARAAQTGFTWNDVLEFAKHNRIVDGKVQGANALVIQVFNRPDLTAAQAQDEVRKYITPEIEEIIGLQVEDLKIQWINNGFINTRNVGTKAFPKMGEYFDTQRMVRVSLMPFLFGADKCGTDEKGNANEVCIDGSRGAGIFIDCGNLHWVPKAVWYCKDASCEKPQCPMGTVGVPPNCNVPPPTPKCPWNPNLPPDSPDCLQPKDWTQTPVNPGWVPLQAGPLTDGRESERQLESGDTSGNVIDNPVPEGTQSGDTTPDLPDGTVTAPDATPNEDPNTGQPVEDTSDDVVQENGNQDDGGTNGDTCIADPDTGEQVCG